MGIPLAHSKFKLSHNFAEFKEMFFRQKVLFHSFIEAMPSCVNGFTQSFQGERLIFIRI